MKAITTMEDKDMILVEDKGNIYRFDAQSTDTADDDNVVTPLMRRQLLYVALLSAKEE